MADASKIIVTEGDAPATPAAGTRVIYAKADGFYSKDDAGVETGMVGVKGDTGDTGAQVESVAFDGDDMKFTLSDASTVLLEDAKIDLKGDTGAAGDMTNPMTAAEDIIYGGVAGAPTRLAIAEQRIIGRITGGSVAGLTAAQVKTLLGISATAETLLDDTTVKAMRATLVAMSAGAYELTDGATIAIDWDNGATQYVVLGATGRTVTFANPVNGQVYRFIIIQDANGSRTITTWPSIKWAGGAAPTLSTGANDIDIVTLLYAGTTYYGDISSDFATPA